MKTTEVVVTKGRKFNYKVLSEEVNASSEITLKATLKEGDIPTVVVIDLQIMIEEMLLLEHDMLKSYYAQIEKATEAEIKKEMYKIWKENGGKFPPDMLRED